MRGNPPPDHGVVFDWGRASRDYALYRPGLPASFWRRVEALEVIRPGSRVLDLGTGTGNLALEFARRGGTVIGVDTSSGQIEQARVRAAAENLAVDFRVAPAESTGLPDHSFDLITAGQCWFYFDPARAIPEVLRLLGPGGRLMTCYLCWMPRFDLIQRETERLVLKHNPNWTGADEPSDVPPIPSWASSHFRVTAMFAYDEPLPFTRETWRGRIRACRAIGATLEPDRVRLFDAELDQLLRKIAGEEFHVLHRVYAHVLEPLNGTAPAEIARRWMEDVWQKRDLSAIDRLHSPEFIDRSPAGRASDRAGYKAGTAECFRAFPDFRCAIEDQIVDPEGRVAIRWTAQGTHWGAFLGHAPTGKRITFRGIEILRIENGLIVERWGEWDGLDLLDQLGGAR